jgi:hypothetical protein
MWQGDPAFIKLPKDSLLSDTRECCVGLLQIAGSGHIIGAATWGFKSRHS